MNDSQTFCADKWFSAWASHCKDIPTAEALSDNNGSLTFAQVEELSGKVYSRLLSLDAGYGSAVLVCTSRGVMDFVIILGILKRGFAYVLAEPSMPPERIEYIRSDCSAVCVIDDSLYENIIADEPYKAGYQRVDDHIPAYLVYTSGTTGRPKGAIHERGNLLFSCQSIEHDGTITENRNTHFSLLCPLNFVATTFVANMSVYSGAHLFIPPVSTLKNKRVLISYLSDNRIDTAFLPPAVLRLFGKELPDNLTTIYTGSDMVGDVYLPKRRIYNLYMMSETGFVICKHLIDRPTSLCPVGKPNPGVEVKLSEEGEILCRAPYFYGYLDGSGKTGDGYLRTGDLAKTDKDGNFVLTGRADDMFKVNGNRVEPAEIEAIVKEHYGLECAVKGFEKDGMSIALYYVSERELDPGRLTEQLKQMLPEYMIPSHFIRLDSLPRTDVGKLDRKNLPAPEAVFEEYVAPRTELEKRFSKAIADELDVERVSLHDDFFLIGGTSLNVLNLISKLELNGLEAEHFYKARKIGEIIGRYLESRKAISLTDEEKEMLGRSTLQPLKYLNYKTIEAIAEYQISADSTVWSLPQIVRLPFFVDMKRLCRAVNAYISSSSTFQTSVVRDSDGKLCFRHSPELVKEIQVEKMSASRVKETIRTFIRPFKLIDELPYRIRLIRGGGCKYLLFDIHHILTDGEGLVLFGNDIFNLYCGRKPGKNDLFAWIADENAVCTEQNASANLESLKKHFDGICWGGFVGTGTEEKRHVNRTILTDIRLKDIDRCLKNRGWTMDSLFCAALALSAAKCSQSKDVLIAFVRSKRAGAVNHAGYRICRHNLGLHLSETMTIDRLVAAVEADRVRSMAYHFPEYPADKENVAPWMIDNLIDIARAAHIWDKWIFRMNPIYDKKYEVGTSPSLMNLMRFSRSRGRLALNPDYNTFFVGDEDVNRLCDHIIDAMKRLISGDESVVVDYLCSTNPCRGAAVGCRS